MKLLVALALVAHVSGVSFFSLGTNYQGLEGMRAIEDWEAFKRDHGKTYSNVDEENLRFSIFHTNKRKIEEHNVAYRQGFRSFSMKINKYADLLGAEFTAVMNGYQMHKKVLGEGATHLRLNKKVQIPDSMDWRQHGAVTPVKDQGQCGSCWAFSSTGALEGQHFRKTGKLVSLSEQNLVDCSTSFGNDGCDGGLMDNAFKYVKANGGIDTEQSYPYDAEDETCKYNAQDVGATDVGFMDVPSGDEEALKEAIAIHGPISIAIDASQTSFQFYHKGVYDDPNCSSTQLDHGVLAVGYGTDEASGRDYWLVKNSWNVSWGDKGYIKIARNENNVCGVATQASFPLV